MNLVASRRGSEDNSIIFGRIALLLWVVTLVFTLIGDMLPWDFIFPLVFFWLLPFVFVNVVEKRDNSSLGFRFNIDKVPRYLSCTLIGYFILASFILLEAYARYRYANEDIYNSLVDRGPIMCSLLIQLMGIGLPEEVFFRGYLMTRLSEWLGDEKGLVLSSLFFGLSHFLSRIIQRGFSYSLSALFIGLQTLFAGLVLGTQYRRTSSIIPSATSHILINLTQSILIGVLLST